MPELLKSFMYFLAGATFFAAVFLLIRKLRIVRYALRRYTTSNEYLPQIMLLKHQVAELSKDLRNLMTAAEFDLSWQHMKLPRVIPVRYFVDGDSADYEKLETGIHNFLNAFLLYPTDEYSPEYGSFFRRLYARSMQLLTKHEMQDKLRKIEGALEVHALQKPIAEVNKLHADAVEKLTTVLAPFHSGALCVGSVLLLKLTDGEGRSSLQVKTLSPAEMLYFEQHPDVLKQPHTLLEHMSARSKSSS